VFCDFALKIREFFARQRTDIAQRSEVFLRALHVTLDEISLPNVFMRTPVPRI
jgi:hypothetical protein